MIIETEMKKIEQTSKYPKTNFTARLLEFAIQYNNKLQTDVLVLKFETGEEYNIPLQFKNAKAKKDGLYGIHPDGSYDSFMSIGLFLDSLQKLSSVDGKPHTNNNDNIENIKVMIGWDNGIPTTFRTIPDSLGKVFHNVATLRKIDDKGEQSKYPDWGISEIELSASTLAPAPKQEVPKQEVPKQEVPKQETPKQEVPKQEVPKQETPKQEVPKQETSVSEVERKILAALIDKGKMSTSDLFFYFERKVNPDVIRKTLETMKGIAVKNGIYEVV